MADSFGAQPTGGGGFNLKRLITTPAFLIISLFILGALAFLWWSSKRSAATAAQAGVVANPLTGPAEGPATNSTVDLTGLQAQIGNLTGLVSSGFAQQGKGPGSNTGNTNGINPINVDAGKFFGNVVGTKGGGYVYAGPGGQGGGLLGFLQPGQSYAITGPDVTGPAYGSSTSPGLVGISSNQYVPIQYGGQTGYLWAPEANVVD